MMKFLPTPVSSTKLSTRAPRSYESFFAIEHHVNLKAHGPDYKEKIGNGNTACGYS
jgi:hypothetical protein